MKKRSSRGLAFVGASDKIVPAKTPLSDVVNMKFTHYEQYVISLKLVSPNKET